MSLKIKKAMLFLHLTSKIALLSPFSLGNEKNPPKYSRSGTLYSLTGLIIYSTFHIMSAQQISSDETNKTGYTLVSLLIDGYNRYIGVTLFAVMIFVGIMHQQKIIKFIKTIENIDSEFEYSLGICDVGNKSWMR